MNISTYKDAINALKLFLRSNDATGMVPKLSDVIAAARAATDIKHPLTKEEAAHINGTLAYMAAYSEDSAFPWPTEGEHFDSIKMALIDSVLSGRK